VFPSALIVPAIWLDVILLLSGSYVITAIVGSLGWGLLFYPNNWPAIAAFHQATEQHGQLMTLADLIGFHFVRTSMPEYIRMSSAARCARSVRTLCRLRRSSRASSR
jgi:methane/ammonia monooxygenase subunit A